MRSIPWTTRPHAWRPSSDRPGDRPHGHHLGAPPDHRRACTLPPRPPPSPPGRLMSRAPMRQWPHFPVAGAATPSSMRRSSITSSARPTATTSSAYVPFVSGTACWTSSDSCRPRSPDLRRCCRRSCGMTGTTSSSRWPSDRQIRARRCGFYSSGDRFRFAIAPSSSSCRTIANRSSDAQANSKESYAPKTRRPWCAICT